MTALLMPAWAGALGPGEMQSQRGQSASISARVDRVVAEDQDLQVELVEELHQVIGEGVVVVDHHQAHRPPPKPPSKNKKAAQMSLGGFRLT